MYVGWFICVISVYNPGSTSYRCHVNSNISLSQRVIGLFVSTEELCGGPLCVLLQGTKRMSVLLGSLFCLLCSGSEFSFCCGKDYEL